nr:hypothetical protein HEP84_01340 [Streptomyces sp. RLB1-33]
MHVFAHGPHIGGVALHDEAGVLTGAIGVSVGMPDQDGEVARAGIAEHDWGAPSRRTSSPTSSSPSASSGSSSTPAPSAASSS